MRLIIIIFICLGRFAAWSQLSTEVHISCTDTKFNQEVKSWIQFTIPVISIQQLSSSPGKYVLLDAREPEEVAVSRIQGAIPVGYDHFDLNQVPKFSSDERIVVYCSIGYRSEKIAEKLKKAGYRQVYNLYGGIFEWVNNHYPVVDSHNKSTTQIHTYNQKWSKWVLNPQIQKVWTK